MQSLVDFKDLEPLTTGYASLDLNLGGIPRGRFVMFSGRENSGKSTLCLNLVASVQDLYPEFNVLWIDNEGSFTKSYAKSCGVNPNTFNIKQDNDIVSCLKEAVEFIQEDNKKDVPSLIVIDSIAGFSTEEEAKKGLDGSTMAIVPRVINKFLRIVTIPLQTNGSVILMTNQLRDNVKSTFGGTTTPGGHGLKHWCNVHLHLYDTSEKVEVGGTVIGQKVAFSVDKARNDNTYKGFSFEQFLVYGKGFSRALDLITVAVDKEVIKNSGAMYYYKDLKWRGKMSLYETLQTDLELYRTIYTELLTKPLTNSESVV